MRLRASTLALAVFATAWPVVVLAADRPNVVVILTDDQGWGDLGLNGNTNLRTPHVDSLARDGAQFDRFFVSPVCSPTRAEFLTGRYHPRGGVRGVTSGGERLDLDEVTVAQVFRRAGYATGAFGKWHNGSQWPYHPLARGFDTFYGFTEGHWGDYFSPPLEQDGRPVRGRGYLPDDLTDHAIDYIRAHRDRPFFCYLPLNIPHSPLQVPDAHFDRFKGATLSMRHQGPGLEDPETTRAALAMCENIDANVGRVLAALDALTLADRTIVVYFSDNGPAAPRWNGGMRGRKGSTDEGGVRSTLLVRWPGRIKAGTVVRPIAAAIDLRPTLVDLAGIPPDGAGPGAGPVDGVSLAPVLLGKAGEAAPGRLIFSQWAGKTSVRTQVHRLDASGRLYDLTTDPGQSRDLAREFPEVTAYLKTAVDRWRDEMKPGFTPDDRPFPVGHRAFPRADLPARDGFPHGNIRRSASAPNCSYFTDWSAPSDRITWDVEVVTSGRYEVTLHYACAPADVGSTIEVDFRGRSLRCRLTEPHDPPLVGAEHDRVPRRGESFVKDFRPLRLGEVSLEKDRGFLTLRAPIVPGRRVAEVRGVSLTLLP